MPLKTIVCLANSFRPGGNCVAGIEYENDVFGQWVRPVSHRCDHAISDLEATCTNGSRCQILDVVEINVDRHAPIGHQTENWLITQGSRWGKVGTLSQVDLLPAIQNPPAQLWNFQSTLGGAGDIVGGFFIRNTLSSLELVQPQSASVEVCDNEYHPERPDVWVSFAWAGRNYRMKLTDPIQYNRFQNGGSRAYHLANPMMCISLAELWEERGTASKLVAGLIT